MPQRKRESFSRRFDKCLFSGPATEECGLLFGLRELLKNHEFFRAANAFGKPRVIQGIPVPLNINADFNIVGNRIHSQLLRMSDIKMKRLTHGVLQKRFSKGTQFKTDVLGRCLEVASENVSQDPPCRHKASSVLGYCKTLRAFLFVGTQGVLINLKACEGYVYNRAPYVGMARRKEVLALRNVPKERRWGGGWGQGTFVIHA